MHLSGPRSDFRNFRSQDLSREDLDLSNAPSFPFRGSTPSLQYKPRVLARSLLLATGWWANCGIQQEGALTVRAGSNWGAQPYLDGTVGRNRQTYNTIARDMRIYTHVCFYTYHIVLHMHVHTTRICVYIYIYIPTCRCTASQLRSAKHRSPLCGVLSLCTPAP